MYSHVRRRGVAMLLVIIALVVATVLTTAYVASRDNSAMIGENVSSAAAARWAAMSGIEIGAAIMETEKEWHAEGGVLLNHSSIAGADLTVTVTDLETGEAPTDSSEVLAMTSTAVVGGVTQTATAVAERAPTDHTVDVDLSEFALFAANTIRMDKTSTLTTWPQAPLAVAGRPVNMGTTSMSASAIQIRESAGAANGRALLKPGSPGSVVDVQGGPSVRSTITPDPIPLPNPPATGVLPPNRLLRPPDKRWDAPTQTVTADARYYKITLEPNSRLNLNGPLTLIADEDFEIRKAAKVVISGAVKLVIFDDLAIDEGAIEVASGGRLEMFVRHEMRITDGYIGPARATAERVIDGSAPYVSDVERIQLWGITPAISNKMWYLDKRSVMIASVYNPYEAFQIRQDSALYGRVVAKDLYLTQNGVVFYDPALDSRRGFTSYDSDIYDAGGRMKTAFRDLSDLSSGTLLLVSTLTGTVVSTADTLIGTVLNPSPPDAGPTEPTPRPVPVEFTLTSFGSETTGWESP